jgi:hypothetical protein
MLEIPAYLLFVLFLAAIIIGYNIGAKQESEKYWELFRSHLETVKSYEDLISYLRSK